eukprot:TRINITY_DN10738_c0_g1_i1.p1 TRINITY_DN10738_c0_g1~~TRINITY_DN10738_c0_g1_i1.p1  ORF type:complete len:686 (+),score=197.64 TRINITY_DN10738_c0_g1_i1:78-2135(+)
MMRMDSVWVLVMAITLFACVTCAPSGFITNTHLDRLEQAAHSAQAPDGTFQSIGDAHLAVETLALLGRSAKLANKEAVCAQALKAIDEADSAQVLFEGVAVTEALGCGATVSSGISDALVDAIDRYDLEEFGPAAKAALLLRNAGHIGSIDLSNVVEKLAELREAGDGTFRDSIDSDEEPSELNAGYALKLFAQLKTDAKLNSDAKAIIAGVVDEIENLLLRIEEDDDLSFFEDNERVSLKATALIVDGIASLSAALGEKDLLLEEHIDGLAQFFVSRRVVGSLEDAYLVVLGATALANLESHAPLVLSLVDSAVVSSAASGAGSGSGDGFIRARVTDIFGNFATSAKVTINRAALVGSAPVLSKAALSQSKTDKSVYEVDFLSTKPSLGLYAVDISVVPSDKRFSSITSAMRTFKVVADVSVADALVSIVDKADRNAAKKETVKFGKTLFRKLVLDEGKHLHVSFAVKNAATDDSVTVQQAFVRLSNDDGEESILAAAQRPDGTYFIEEAIEVLGEPLRFVSGSYELSVIVGDVFVHNPVHWELGSIELTFDEAREIEEDKLDLTAAADITHVYRTPDSRPPSSVSFAFTGLVLAPILVLFLGLHRVGVNLGNFPTSGLAFIAALVFQLSIAGMLALFILYWLELDIFSTLTYLGALGGVAVVSGLTTLRALSHARTKAKAKAD